MATTIRNQSLFCTCCGQEFKINYPIPVDELVKKTEAFELLHKDCNQTYVEPKADQNKSVKEKAMWWLSTGERGMSSETMWHCFMGNDNFSINHPYDPDDFKRCYKLLEAIPEWKEELHKLKPLSQAWSNLVDNWDKLNEYFEDMIKHNKANGMYEFMQTLIR
jgi:hypothetical protein